MIDIFVKMPGASAKEVEQRVTSPMEKLLWEIPGVEYVYSTSSPGISMAVVRFYVGQNEEESIVRLQSKLMANFDLIPWAVSPPLIKPCYIDDVPILALTFWGEGFDHYTLRRVAAEVENIVKRENNVSTTTLIGGERRQIQVRLDPVRLAASDLDLQMVEMMVTSANQESAAGTFPSTKGQVLVHAGGFLKTVEDVKSVVVGVHGGKPVYLRDVADVVDGPEEPEQYVFFGTGPAAAGKEMTGHVSKGVYPAVVLAIAKRKGANAVTVAHKVLERMNGAVGSVIPDNMHITVTRNYGDTAKEKSDELLFHMMIAIVSVTILIWFVLGHRESGVVAIAIPVTLALTMAVFYLYGYTLNRITLFALIFSIGILVDDAIVVVENIVRHFRLPQNHNRSRTAVAIEAVDEVGNPTILATLTVIAAILPMAFVGGLMGPYMRPIPVGASAAMVFSLVVALIVTPWASLRLIKHKETESSGGPEDEDWSTRLYRRVMTPLIANRFWRWIFLITVVVLLLASCAMVGIGWVRVKMLPFDNKSEFQVILDMPEAATLEETSAAAMEMGDYLKTVNEINDYQIFVGTSAPFNFNGLVRHYYLRRGPHLADIQVNLAKKGHRKKQSHAIAKRVRPALKEIADRYHARVKVAEVPPGPPVLSTLVAEIYGPNYDRQQEIAAEVMKVFEKTPGVVDVDWYVEEEQPRYQITVDKEKAALHGISVAKIAGTIELALKGRQAGLLHQSREKEDVPIIIRLPLSARAGIQRLEVIKLASNDGSMVPLSTLINVRKTPVDHSIYHKNLMPVVYVVGDLAGVKESPVYAILEMKNKIDSIHLPEGYKIAQHTAALPSSNRKYEMKWDGEWHITYEVFRDLGIAFAVVLVLIFVLVVGWFQSFSTPMVIMAAIPFSLIGILPVHWALGAFFTATSMIGFIAGAGIVVRNSIILVDFIELRLKEGMPLDLAVIDAGAVRFRPMMLTAAAVVASLLFSRMTVPILYFLDKRWEFAHGYQTPPAKGTAQQRSGS